MVLMVYMALIFFAYRTVSYSFSDAI